MINTSLKNDSVSQRGNVETDYAISAVHLLKRMLSINVVNERVGLSVYEFAVSTLSDVVILKGVAHTTSMNVSITVQRVTVSLFVFCFDSKGFQ